MHPYTISALDLSKMDDLADTVNQLASALDNVLTNQEQADKLLQVFVQTQKIDYDADLYIEPATDGVIDLYDFAEKIMATYNVPAIDSAAQNLITVLDTAIISEEHFSDNPWLYPDRTWDLDNVHGLSIYLPLGEDLELPILITETTTMAPTDVVTRNLRLREMYSDTQLQFVADTDWDQLIDTYYTSIAVLASVRNQKTLGLLHTDYTPPQSVITFTGQITIGEMITMSWSASDLQAGIKNVTLWYRPTHSDWSQLAVQSNATGVYLTEISDICRIGFAALATDKAGNQEIFGGKNFVYIEALPCKEIFLPIMIR